MHRDLELVTPFSRAPHSTARGAARQRDLGHGRVVSYSRKVFIPLTQLCRNVCHYCSFAKTPGIAQAGFLRPKKSWKS